MRSKFTATAPSNIALIKYMGKTSHTENYPSNGSLSWSLNHLLSKVEIEESIGEKDSWEPLVEENWSAPALSESGQNRFLDHFQCLKNELRIIGNFVVRSANNFPADCGVASSASSFAGLTLAAYEVAKAQNPNIDVSIETLSGLSRKGSGSSCRSLYSAWAIWKSDHATSVELKTTDLEHQLILVEDSKKEVSSSEAHKRVTTSDNFRGRVERAKQRLEDLLQSLDSLNWRACYEITRDEFEDMHELFETSKPGFSYRTKESFAVVKMVNDFWTVQNDGPLVTMDAGANVHLLWRNDQKEMANCFAKQCDTSFDIKIILSPGLSI